MAIFPGGPRIAGTRMSSFWILLQAKDDGGGGDNWKCKACKAPVKSSNKPTCCFFTDQMPFLSPNQQCQSTEGRLSPSLIMHNLIADSHTVCVRRRSQIF